jgi:hypothetical protein
VELLPPGRLNGAGLGLLEPGTQLPEDLGLGLAHLLAAPCSRGSRSRGRSRSYSQQKRRECLAARGLCRIHAESGWSIDSPQKLHQRRLRASSR